MFSNIRSLIFKLDPETAHSLAIKSLKFNFVPNILDEDRNNPLFRTEIFNKNLENPIGMAAGFDKNAEVYNSLFKLGFGFVEVGTVTPLKQYGNPKPRVFRLVEDEALINRLGFNNLGAKNIVDRIKQNNPIGLLGVNIGPNKDTRNKIEDYVENLKAFHNIADYITINISSPNTEGLRDFHNKNKLEKLLIKLNNIRKEKNIPLLLKISPDIKDEDIPEITSAALKNNISAIILTNTTNKNRENLISEVKKEQGGLSGEPIQKISTEMIKKFYKILRGKIPLIGVGGINSGKSAYEKIIAGASLLQLYTGFVYKGPNIVKDIKKELIQILKNEGIKNIKDAVGKSVN